jgi:type III secretion protein V
MPNPEPHPLTTPGPINLGRYADLALAALVVAVIIMMALPLPPWSLDILVAVNISAGVTLLLVALFVPTPLAFSTFPSVLLITTLFRISLNVATTRQILLHSHGGDIIDTFGRMVVGGSLVVGLVVFLIITVVQFIVVAKGAERVAEVGARFTLDALPGKQMSIDADLRSGVISQLEAVKRRSELVQESHFYGSMDGAMKFVKGDAIAGIIIVAVNLLGGIAIGTLSMGMGFSEAIERFSVLSIGDGLVTQIPALFVSIAAGIAITRTAPDSSANLGDQIAKQLGAQPRALMLAAGVIGLFALVPGFPTITFLVLCAALACASVALTRRQREQREQQTHVQVQAAAREGEIEPVLLTPSSTEQPSTSSTFRLKLSPSLIDNLGASALNTALREERHTLRQHYGIPFPGLDLQADPTLPEHTFSIVVQDLTELTVTLPINAQLVTGPLSANTAKLAYLDLTPPEWLLPARWISTEQANEWPATAGPQILQPAQVLARLVMRTIQRHPASALGLQAVKQLISDIETRYADLTREALGILPLGRLADLMVTLARERVPLADFPGFLQAVVSFGPGSANTHTLYEAIRNAMARAIVARLMPPIAPDQTQPPLTAITLEPAFESWLREALVMKDDGPMLALSPPDMDSAVLAIINAFEAAAPQGTQVLALASDIRRAASRLFRTHLPRAAFLSHEEIKSAGIVAKLTARAKWVPLADT